MKKVTYSDQSNRPEFGINKWPVQTYFLTLDIMEICWE